MDFLNKINTSKMTESELYKLEDIKDLYQRLKIISVAYHSTKKYILSKSYFILAYNLFNLKLRKQAIQMLAEVIPEYYQNRLIEDIKEAYDLLYEIDELYYKKDKKSLERIKHCRREGEFLIIALAMVEKLKKVDDFRGIEQFNKQIATIENTKWMLDLKGFK